MMFGFVGGLVVSSSACVRSELLAFFAASARRRGFYCY